MEEGVSGGARRWLGHGLSRWLDRASRGVKGISDGATLSSRAAADTRPVARDPNLEHVWDVGGDRRVGEEHGLQVVGGDAGADGHRKYVDGHVGVRPEQGGAGNAARALLR